MLPDAAKALGAPVCDDGRSGRMTAVVHFIRETQKRKRNAETCPLCLVKWVIYQIQKGIVLRTQGCLFCDPEREGYKNGV